MAKILVNIDDCFPFRVLEEEFSSFTRKKLVDRFPEAEVTIKLIDGYLDPHFSYTDDFGVEDDDKTGEVVLYLRGSAEEFSSTLTKEQIDRAHKAYTEKQISSLVTEVMDILRSKK